MITIRHSHEDGTLIEGSVKGDGVYEIARRHGFRWFPSIKAIGVQGSRDHEANQWKINGLAAALRGAGHEVTVEIDDTWRPTAVREAERTARAEERAERLDERAGKAAGRSATARAGVDRIGDGIPFGQPILVGHHSEGKARRDIARMDAGMRKAIAEGEYADELARRAQGVDSTQAQRHNPRVTMRRIEKLEADLRRWRRNLATAHGGYHTRCVNAIAKIEEEIGHWKATLAEHEALGTFTAWAPDRFLPGDQVHVLGRWLPVRRVNLKSVSVPGSYGTAMSGLDASWSETIPWDRIGGRRREGWQLDKPNGQPWPVELADKVARWRDLLRRAEFPPCDHDSRRCAGHVFWAQRLVHGLDVDASRAEVKACWPDKADVTARRELVASYVDVYDRLQAGELVQDVAASLATVDTAPSWRLPADREPEDRRAGPCGWRTADTQPLIAVGDLVKGYYDTGGRRRLVRDFCGPVASVSAVNDRRERGTFVTIRLVDGAERDLQTHMWLAVYPAGTWEVPDVEPSRRHRVGA